MISSFVVLVLFSRIFFLCVALLAVFLIPLREGYLGNQLYPTESEFIWVWANFDGRHYLDIAINGYRNYNFAFFPFYSFLVFTFNLSFNISQLYAGLFISLVCFVSGLGVVYKIVKLDYSQKVARLSVLLLSFFPLSFFYHAVYPDSLFLLLSSSSFYFARRGNWLLSGIFGCLTVLTRLSGVALFPALAAEWYLQNSKWFKIEQKSLLRFFKTGAVTLFLIILGFVIYLTYLQVFFGDFLLFQKSMIAWRQDEWIFPLQVLWRYLKIFYLVDKTQIIYWIAVLEFLSILSYIGLAVYVWKKVRVSYGVFMVALLMLVTFTGTFAGTPRYILHLFPGFLGLALLIKDKKILIFITAVIYLILGLILTGLFTRGYFVS